MDEAAICRELAAKARCEAEGYRTAYRKTKISHYLGVAAICDRQAEEWEKMAVEAAEYISELEEKMGKISGVQCGCCDHLFD